MCSKILDILKITTKALFRLSSHKCKIYWILYDDIFVAPVRILHFLPTNLEGGRGVSILNPSRGNLSEYVLYSPPFILGKERDSISIHLDIIPQTVLYRMCVQHEEYSKLGLHYMAAYCCLFLWLCTFFADSMIVLAVWEREGRTIVGLASCNSWQAAVLRWNSRSTVCRKPQGFCPMLFMVPYSIVFISLLCFLWSSFLLVLFKMSLVFLVVIYLLMFLVLPFS
jgi:hypothetical protein